MPRPRSPELSEALRLVAEGFSMYAAAKATGIQQSAILRARRSDARPKCPHCGQPVRSKSA